MARQKELHPKAFTQIPSQIPKVERKKQSQTRNQVPLPEKGTLLVPNCGATKVANLNVATDSRVHERLAKLINEVMFEAKKPGEAKIKEEAIRFFASNIAKALSRKLMS